jgi:hypothetical protein
MLNVAFLIFMLNVNMLSVVMLNVVMLNIDMLNVVGPKRHHKHVSRSNTCKPNIFRLNGLRPKDLVMPNSSSLGKAFFTIAREKDKQMDRQKIGFTEKRKKKRMKE